MISWAITAEKIGFIAIYGWNEPKIEAQCAEILEQMRDTRGLIIDVRLNGGGGEPLAPPPELASVAEPPSAPKPGAGPELAQAPELAPGPEPAPPEASAESPAATDLPSA